MDVQCIHNKHSYSYEYNNLDIINEKCELLSNSCLNWEELDDYLCANNGYAIHIKNLKIFDEPRELSDYYDIHIKSHLYNAPQNMMYCYDYIKTKQGLTGVCNGHYVKKILISIHPEWLCKILNGEKTIEFRKKVLKEML